MDDYIDTRDDNGGVHLNSGIPNRAFHLAATAIGGSSWSGAGAIWYAALTGDAVGPDTDFAGFAAATVAAAGEHADAVRQAWETVGVTPQAAGTTPSGGTGSDAGTDGDRGAASLVWVRRTGGFAGRTYEGALDLEGTTSASPRCGPWSTASTWLRWRPAGRTPTCSSTTSTCAVGERLTCPSNT